MHRAAKSARFAALGVLQQCVRIEHAAAGLTKFEPISAACLEALVCGSVYMKRQVLCRAGPRNEQRQAILCQVGPSKLAKCKGLHVLHELLDLVYGSKGTRFLVVHV